MQYALELKNVHYAYHTLEGETYALKDIRWTAHQRGSTVCGSRDGSIREEETGYQGIPDRNRNRKER